LGYIIAHPLDGLLVDISLAVVAGLLNLVAQSVLGGGQTVKTLVNLVHEYSSRNEESLPGGGVDVAILGDLLVGLLGSTRGSALNGLRDVVGGLLDGLHCD
jgi:hypothetical protein